MRPDPGPDLGLGQRPDPGPDLGLGPRPDLPKAASPDWYASGSASPRWIWPRRACCGRRAERGWAVMTRTAGSNRLGSDPTSPWLWFWERQQPPREP